MVKQDIESIPTSVAENFYIHNSFLENRPYGCGHINDRKLNSVMFDDATELMREVAQ